MELQKRYKEQQAADAFLLLSQADRLEDKESSILQDSMLCSLYLDDLNFILNETEVEEEKMQMQKLKRELVPKTSLQQELEDFSSKRRPTFEDIDALMGDNESRVSGIEVSVVDSKIDYGFMNSMIYL